MGICVSKNHKLALYVRTAEVIVGSAHPERAREAFTWGSTDRSMHLRRRTQRRAPASLYTPRRGPPSTAV